MRETDSQADEIGFDQRYKVIAVEDQNPPRMSWAPDKWPLHETVNIAQRQILKNAQQHLDPLPLELCRAYPHPQPGPKLHHHLAVCVRLDGIVQRPLRERANTLEHSADSISPAHSNGTGVAR